MVELNKLIKAVSAAIRACASMLYYWGSALMRLATRIEKRSAFK